MTAAALLFTVAIGAFASSKIVFIRELGIGSALAVLIDASIVRATARTVAHGTARLRQLVGAKTPTAGLRALWLAGPRQPAARGLQLTGQAEPARPR